MLLALIIVGKTRCTLMADTRKIVLPCTAHLYATHSLCFALHSRYHAGQKPQRYKDDDEDEDADENIELDDDDDEE